MEDKNLHFVGNVAQKAIIEHQGKFLVCRGIGDEVLELPGGRLHINEEPQDGLRREIFEELGLRIAVEYLVDTCLSFHVKSNSHNMFVVYKCRVEGGTLSINKSEVEEMKWVSKEELVTLPFFDDCKKAINVFCGLTRE